MLYMRIVETEKEELTCKEFTQDLLKKMYKGDCYFQNTGWSPFV